MNKIESSENAGVVHKGQPVLLQAVSCRDSGEEEFSFGELLGVIWSGKFFIIGFTLLCTLVAVYWTLYQMPVVYRSVAVLSKVDEGNQGFGSKIDALSSLLSLDIGGGGGNDNIKTFLESRTLQERLIRKYDLLPHIYADSWDRDAKNWKGGGEQNPPTVEEAVQTNALLGCFEVQPDKKSNLISLKWYDREPVFAKQMLEHVINEIEYYLDNEYINNARRERKFIETQLEKITKELEFWERQIPTKALTLDRILRERTASQTVYTELRKQLELAKIREAREIVSFRVLDPPFVPIYRAKPERTKICSITMALSCFFAVFFVFLKSTIKVKNVKPDSMTTE